MTPDENAVNGSKLATGLYLAALTDGSVADLSDDDAFGITAAAAEVPSVAGDAIGIDRKDADAFGPVGIQSALLGEFYDASFIRMFEDMEADTVGTVESMKSRRREAAYRFSGMSEEDVARAEEDAQMGDMSAIISAKEKFYLG